MPRISGVPNMSIDDKKLLLQLIEKHLPKGSEQWGMVERQFNHTCKKRAERRNQRHIERSVAALKNAFSVLASKKKPTGQ